MTIRLDARTCVTVLPSVYARAFGKELVLLDFARGEYFGLDEVGAEIWRALAEGKELGAVADHLAATFAVEREEALQDIIALVEELHAQHLVAFHP
jgi:hypothetical protein